MKRLITGFIIVLAGLGLSAGSSYGVPPYAGVVSIDSVDARPGDKFSLGVYLNGGEVDLSGLSIPLRHGSTMITVDSVSFVGSIAPAGVIRQSFVDNAARKFRIAFYPNVSVSPIQSIPKSGGLLARVYMTLSNLAQPGTIEIDTIYLRDSVEYEDSVVYLETETLNASDPQALTSLYPSFDPGLIQVQVPTGTGDEDEPVVPGSFVLSQNYPNPFNPSTQISFSVPKRGEVSLDVFNVLGQQVAELVSGVLPAGNHELTFQASSLPSGIYFYRLTHDGGSQTRKMIFLK